MKGLYDEAHRTTNYEEFLCLINGTKLANLIDEFYYNNMSNVSFDKNKTPLYFDQYKGEFLNRYMFTLFKYNNKGELWE